MDDQDNTDEEEESAVLLHKQVYPIKTSISIAGSSIVRGVAPMVNGREFDACGFVYGGRTAKQINDRIGYIPDTDVTVIAAGTNNVETDSIKETTKQIGEVINNVATKRKGKHVIMSTIPHRYDKPELNDKIDRINTFIEEQVKHQPNWALLRHELNRRDYKRDGLHLNKRGVAKYAHEIRHIIRATYTLPGREPHRLQAVAMGVLGQE